MKTKRGSDVTKFPLDGFAYENFSGWSGKFRKMSLGQYRALRNLDRTPDENSNEELSSETILLLDQLDTEVDLPLVAGIIIKQPLRLDQTHTRVLARKLGIPIVVAPNVNFDEPFFSQNTYHSLVVEPTGSVYIRSDSTPILPRRFQSVLPATSNRKSVSEAIVSVASSRDWKLQAPEVVGRKFLDLALFLSKFPHLGPKIFSVTSRVYENFLDLRNENGVTLRNFIQFKLESISTKSESEQHHLLSSIREAIMTWHPGAITRQIPLDELPQGPFSVRSNNELEDLLGAGIYESTRANSRAELEYAIRTVYASMYTYRAYQIRKFWGQREENLSMPVLIHSYISEQRLSGNARFQLSRSADGVGIRVAFDLVYGAVSQATSPSYSSKVAQLFLETNARGQTHPVKLSAPIESQVLYSLIQLVNEVFQSVRHDFFARAINPESLDLEFLLLTDPSNPRRFRPVVLQYKKQYGRDVTIDILKGDIAVSALDQSISFDKLSPENGISTICQTLNLRNLSEYDPETNGELRYALITVNKIPQLILWDSRDHVSVQLQLRSLFPTVRWIRSGYVRYDSIKSVLDFSSTTYATTDVDVHQPLLSRSEVSYIFENAISYNSLGTSSVFSAWSRLHRGLTIHFNPGGNGFLTFHSR